MELESRRSEVLNLSFEEREVGVSHAERLKKKKKKKGWDLGLMVDNNVIFFFLGFTVNIVETIKIGLYGGDMAGNHFHFFYSILKLGKKLVKVF